MGINRVRLEGSGRIVGDSKLTKLHLRFSTNKSRTSKNKNAAPKRSLIGVIL